MRPSRHSAICAEIQQEHQKRERRMVAELEKLRIEAEELRTDAERYRWLRTAAHDWGICQWDRAECEWVRDSRGATVINQAVDAAMAAQKP